MTAARAPRPGLHIDPMPVLYRIVLLLAFGNVAAGLALVTGDPGSSATFALMREVVPLPVWGSVLVVAGSLQASGGGRVVWGHGLGAAVWLFIAGAAVLGLLLGISASGAGSALLGGLLVTVAGLHMNGIWFRQQEALAARGER